MWLFTKYGFCSAVCARQGDGSHGQPVDPNTVMVRARVCKRLESLINRFPDFLGDCEIKEFAGTDFQNQNARMTLNGRFRVVPTRN